MAIVNPPAWIQAGTYNARADRLSLLTMLTEPGVTQAVAYQVTQTLTPSMSVLVSTGTAYVLNTYSSVQGYYAVVNDGPITVSLNASNANFSRIDLIVLRVYDSQYEGTLNLAQVEAIPGDPSTSPAPPPVPNNSIILATVTVPALSSSVVDSRISTSLRQYAHIKPSLVDTTRLVTSTSRPTNPYSGQQILESDTLASRMYVGGSEGWRVTSPSTPQIVTSSTRPTGIKVWPGMYIFESDTKRIYMWDGSKWAYQSGGNGEPLGPLIAWNPNYTPATAANALPIKLWRDGTGRINLSGTISNAVPFGSWTVNYVYGFAIIPAPYIPYNDIPLASQLNMPIIGNDPINIIIRGTGPSQWPGSPGTICWQPGTTRTISTGVRTLIFNIPQTSWEQQ